MNTLNKTISVIEPVNEAIARTKTILFAPFNLEKWMIIGFCAWLAGLLEGGIGGFNGVRHRYHGDTAEIPAKASQAFEGGVGGFNGVRYHGDTAEIPAKASQAIEFCKANMLIVIPIAAATILLVVFVMLILLWLSSRGKFMFLDCLAKNKAHIKEPWKTFRKQANGLLGFRLLLMVTALLWVIAVGILTIWLVSLAKFSNAGAVIIGIIICAMILLLIIVSLFFGLIQVLTFDFVMPIMYLQRTGISASWAKFLPLLRHNFWKIFLYLLFKIVIIFCIGTITMVLVGVSCCCLCGIGIILFIPYIGTVILLPLPSFYRLYSLCYLRQFGSDYDVFAAAA